MLLNPLCFHISHVWSKEMAEMVMLVSNRPGIIISLLIAFYLKAWNFTNDMIIGCSPFKDKILNNMFENMKIGKIYYATC